MKAESIIIVLSTWKEHVYRVNLYFSMTLANSVVIYNVDIMYSYILPTYILLVSEKSEYHCTYYHKNT